MSPETSVIRISVRNLVEFILRSGDLDTRTRRGSDLEAALAGGRIHRKLQGKEKSGYEKEKKLSRDTAFGEFVIRVEGRADGVMEGDPPCIDEIKGMYLDVNLLEEPFAVHLAQAKCYAAIYAKDMELQKIGVRMSYVNLDNEEIKYFHFEYGASEIEEWYNGVVLAYEKWARWQYNHRVERDRSMQNLPFPFEYRRGQQKLTHAVYKTVKDAQDLFLMAPTGVGKTMSCVYPSVRALGEGYGDRIFYLTARNETLSAGREAFSILIGNGLDIRAVLITSKEKICPLSEPSCNPDDCPYARGHFDRINDAVYELLCSRKFIDRDTVLRQAEAKTVCPFELTLDLASWCDAVLGDYNYVFDPNVKLKRFFAAGTKGDGIFLIDEAHNLVERGRSMYSASLVKEHILSAKRAAGKGNPRLTKALDKANRLMLAEKHLCDGEPDFAVTGKPVRIIEKPADLQPLIYAALGILEELQNLFQESGDAALKEKLLDFYFEVRDFEETAEYLDENYTVYSGYDEEDHFMVRLFCVNPSGRLMAAREAGRCMILFSATLLPISYYKRLIGNNSEAAAIYAESPFDETKRLILAGNDVSTRYTERSDAMYKRIAGYIARIASCRKGNYMVFFPSYRMMKDVFRIYKKEYDRDGVNWVLQTPGMQEEDREIFLENFYDEPRETLIGFCVMGGMFSEGIDLKGTRLIGAVIVGAGIPQVSAEREILKRSFDRDGSGFDYAYRYPGMNKVQQAAGRVIRTAEDTGVIVLLDERFNTSPYRRLFPREWSNVKICSAENAADLITEFWNRS